MYQDSAGFDEAASSSMSSAGSAMEDGHGAAENEVAGASSSAASTSSAAQPLLAALTDAQQVRVSLMDTDIIITDSESIAQLRQFLESQPSQVVADVSKADEIGTIELVPGRGAGRVYHRGLQNCVYGRSAVLLHSAGCGRAGGCASQAEPVRYAK